MATGESSDALSKPFVIGSIATWLGKKAEESRSHEWTIYLRAANPEEDLSLIVRKVVFVLHPTLQPPTRTIETAPFEVTDQGWGEFEVTLQVYFHDSRDKPIELSHMLKLYPPGEQVNIAGKPVVAERYDEFVFNSPSEGLRQRLLTEAPPSIKGWKHSANGKWFTDFEADAPVESQSLQQIYQVITSELQTASKRRRLLEDELKQLQGQNGL
ncbi:protein af-9-like protein [Chrysochromulina tobinii]|uniref:Protein af-9-like protein n=1 Tax=Chrysochromulina tobinii TaxID=1460289 RepID=A0A0M0J615_9EUKA|nr:protein af-9-like protein [Chrysochromulina tobinii]|eukprot:KOO21663.1 protein af-9-like protein [Chrysochromulina sp. CCMP291]